MLSPYSLIDDAARKLQAYTPEAGASKTLFA